MKKLKHILPFAILLANCNSQPVTPNDYPVSLDSSSLAKDTGVQKVANNYKDIVPTHLHDSLVASGDFILFLRPDSVRFESYAKDEKSGIYEVDSDFGFGLSATDDSIKANKKYANIKLLVSEARYIKINDCKTCPMVIDRDTVNYGVILSSRGKAIQTKYNAVHSGNYIYQVANYFGLEK